LYREPRSTVETFVSLISETAPRQLQNQKQTQRLSGLGTRLRNQSALAARSRSQKKTEAHRR